MSLLRGVWRSRVGYSRHGEKTPPNKTQAPTEGMDMDIWAVGILNRYLYEVLILKLNLQNNKVVSGKTPFFVIGSFCTFPSNCLNISF